MSQDNRARELDELLMATWGACAAVEAMCMVVRDPRSTRRERLSAIAVLLKFIRKGTWQ